MINTMTTNAAILADARLGSHASSVMSALLPSLGGKARGCVEALPLMAAHELGAYGVPAQRQAQVQPDEQRWSVFAVDGTDLIAPKTARMGAASRGVSGPYPWRRPV